MDSKNKTLATELFLIGFSRDLKINRALFALFLAIYLATLLGNVLIFCVVLISSHLHTPMYFFLCILAILDLCNSTTVVPRMLSDLISFKNTISIGACNLQCFIILLLSGTESLLLALMAYDRYAAICCPLRYPILMRWSLCYQLTAFVWIMSFIIFIIPPLFVPVVLCNPNQVNHFMCEVLAVIRLACDSIDSSKIVMFLTCFVALLLPFMFIIISYICIIFSILKVHSTRRSKAFQTCTSHITVVALSYGTAIIMYFGPSTEYSVHQGKYLSLFSHVICPALNPIIYSLNNKEVKAAQRKFKKNLLTT
uniref:Olfactory receptor n=1 Tax=Pyxicephalus adspersus TaxID=30357 RepID=A0AAV3ACZ6_PYXAD|nr:TPA: hypothetical protein GDO54_009917 [Pyxicephalus adspersus]